MGKLGLVLMGKVIISKFLNRFSVDSWGCVSSLGCSLKNSRMIFVYFQGKLFNITLIQVCASKTNAEEVEVEELYEDLEDILKLTPPKDAFFIIGGWNAKVGSQEIPGVSVKFGLGVQNEAGQRLTVLPREHTDHSKHPLPTTQE